MNAELRSEVMALRASIAELEARLNQNPRNSSMPPSSEGLAKPPANRAERRSLKRRQGKQPGSESRHLAQVIYPDEVVTHVSQIAASRVCGPRMKRSDRDRDPPGLRAPADKGSRDRAPDASPQMPMRSRDQSVCT